MDQKFDDDGIQPAATHCVAKETGITETVPLQARWNETGITETPHKESPREFGQAPSIVVSRIVLLRRRFLITVVGVAVGAVIALLIAGPISGSRSISDRVFIWLSVMNGPIIGTYVGMQTPSIILGWWGLILAPAHSMRPSVLTAVITLVGLGLWFFAGLEFIRHYG